ncbi:DUF998 domain-containing protein [Blautia hydrogenotrophica]|uniref:DUF998 domain-containing protein n=1 Tax=Blautia hydrogenotrophica TaxID=53443 RepID=UPI002E75C36B|nr:DUF998 domain-containing protein [Blautia hydrogenotrophica]MEE0462866.1 DUF998 domain-containing protein [Blautia hydrogenotrophica]
MKNNVMLILPIVFILDLLIPFTLAPAYKGYNHLTQVMSVLGNSKVPLHSVYNTWLVVFGITLAVTNFKVYAIVSEGSRLIAVILFVILLVYAIGGCILSGLFSVGEGKSLNSLSEKIHGYGSVIGFTCLTFAPLLLGIYTYKRNNIKFSIFSNGCFILALLCFSCFVMGDKPNCKNTFLAFEGLWQRLSLLFMYLPLGCLALFEK